jgi:moderate conductance mechanosensitive channel
VATINVAVDFSAEPDEVLKVLRDVAMSVRTDPKFSSAFLDDPQLLGVDSIKGSQVIYPIIFKTLANQQWGPQRELQRRVRLALAEHGMLPGDPNRVFNAAAGHSLGSGGAKTEAPAHAPDPTAAKPHEINPFTGEGL